MFFSRHDCLKRRLLSTRPMTSLIDKEILSDGDHIQFDSTNWVRCWCDTGHRKDFPHSEVHALRAITTDGALFWLVFHARKKHPFHADSETAEDAVAMAHTCWARRRAMRQRMGELGALRRDVLSGQKGGTMKRSQKTGQLARVYPKPLKGYENGEAPEFCRSV